MGRRRSSDRSTRAAAGIAKIAGWAGRRSIALLALIYDKTGIPFSLTIGWMVKESKVFFQHDDQVIVNSSN